MPHEDFQHLRPVTYPKTPAAKKAARQELEVGADSLTSHRHTYHGCLIETRGEEQQSATTHTGYPAYSAHDLHERHNRTSRRIPTAQTSPATHPMRDLQARHGHHEQMFRHEQRRQPLGDTWTVLAAAYVQDRKILFSDSRAYVQDGKVIIADHVLGGPGASDRHTPRRRHSVHGHLTSHVSDVTEDKDRSQQDIMRTAVRDLFNQGRSESRHVTNVAVRRTSDDSPADGTERTKENSKLSLLAKARTRLREVEPLRVEIQNLESQAAELNEEYQRISQKSRDARSPAGAFIDDGVLARSYDAPRASKKSFEEVESKLNKARYSLMVRLEIRIKKLKRLRYNLTRLAREAAGSRLSLIELEKGDAGKALEECAHEQEQLDDARTDVLRIPFVKGSISMNVYEDQDYRSLYKEMPDC